MTLNVEKKFLNFLVNKFTKSKYCNLNLQHHI